MNWKVLPWLSAGFSAFLCILALTMSLQNGYWKPVFFSFLPICFVFIGIALAQMHREIQELRDKTHTLERLRS